MPATYERARVALKECDEIDECWNWANKSEALASYAAQAKDETLKHMADRIQARAVRRAGELLEAIPPQPGRRVDLLPPGGGTPPRSVVIRKAGLSRDQARQALRIARIPAAEFERAVESDMPPTVTALAKAAPRKKPPKPSKPKHRYAAALPLLRDVVAKLQWLAMETSGPYRGRLKTLARNTTKILSEMEGAA